MSKTEAEIKAMFGDWQAKVAEIPTLPPSILIGCLANGENLVKMLGLHEKLVDPTMQQEMSLPEQETFIKHLNQIFEYTLEQVRNEIDKRFGKVDTKA